MSIEDVEAELRRRIEELKGLKKRLKELEEEERKLLDELSELGLPRRSIVAKYVKCGKEGCRKCPHGPYYYLVWKEGGKTKWKYIGKVVDAMEAEKRKKAKIIIQKIKEIQRERKMLEKLSLKLLGR